jgi:uncharacterized membrane protein
MASIPPDRLAHVAGREALVAAVEAAHDGVQIFLWIELWTRNAGWNKAPTTHPKPAHCPGESWSRVTR